MADIQTIKGKEWKLSTAENYHITKGNKKTERKGKKSAKQSETNGKMAVLSLYLSRIVLNINGLFSPLGVHFRS
jgi:hypothetical protein